MSPPVKNAGTEPAEAEGWRPEAGSRIAGRVIAVQVGWSDYLQGNYPILVIEGEDGKVTAVHGFQAVLRNRLLTLRPKVGESVTITCHGKRATKDGKREVVPYTVEVAGRSGDEAWDVLGGPGAPAGGPVRTGESDVPADDEAAPY